MSDKTSTPAQPHATEMTLDDAMQYAVQLQQEGRVEGAAQIYRRILELVPDHVDALHFLGVATFQLGDGETAVDLIKRAITLNPQGADAYNNLGNVLLRLDHRVEAAEAYQQVIALDPQNANAYSNLGALLRTTDQHVEAEALLRRALELAPQHAEAFHNLGNLLSEQQRLTEAAQMYSQAMMLRPYDGRNYFLLGMTLYGLKREDEALKIFKRWLELEPKSCEAQHMVAAATQQAVPDRAADLYVQRTFDRFAESFDGVLQRLEYQAPQLLVERVTGSLGPEQSQLDILDAGCGTGLCGPLIKSWARCLVGVDLSPKMLEKAQRREVYDQLVVSELTNYLSTHPAAYDVVISSDTLCYFGDLTAVSKAGAISLRPSGVLGFTVEKAEELEAPNGYAIRFHGRYGHTESYIRRVVTAAGLSIELLEEVVLRQERNEPVHGVVVIASKPTE